jgi:hypothetical protein
MIDHEVRLDRKIENLEKKIESIDKLKLKNLKLKVSFEELNKITKRNIWKLLLKQNELLNNECSISETKEDFTNTCEELIKLTNTKKTSINLKMWSLLLEQCDILEFFNCENEEISRERLANINDELVKLSNN